MSALDWLLIGSLAAFWIAGVGWYLTLRRWHRTLEEATDALEARKATLDEWHRALEQVDDP